MVAQFNKRTHENHFHLPEARGHLAAWPAQCCRPPTPHPRYAPKVRPAHPHTKPLLRP